MKKRFKSCHSLCLRGVDAILAVQKLVNAALSVSNGVVVADLFHVLPTSHKPEKCFTSLRNLNLFEMKNVSSYIPHVYHRKSSRGTYENNVYAEVVPTKSITVSTLLTKIHNTNRTK